MIHRSHSNKSKSKDSANKDMLYIISASCAVLSIIALSSVVIIQKSQSMRRPNQLYMSGRTARSGSLEYKVSGVKDTINYIPSMEPLAGQKIIQLHLDVTNTGNKTVSFYPVTQSFVRDSQGVTYQLHPTRDGDPYQAGDIEPGKTISGTLSYLVTSQTIPLSLYFENNTTGVLPVVYKVQ